MPYIYSNIYFLKLKNLPHSFSYSLIIDPKIIKEQGIIFNKGWKVHPSVDSIQINPHDTQISSKINQIQKYVKENMTSWLPPFMQHEVLIHDKIDLGKYLLAVVIFDITEISKIKRIIKDTLYSDIKILIGNTLPSYSELL